MTAPTHLDFLILGQGLAGSLLAWRLISADQKVLVIDNPAPTAASRVAAGLINPVTGKRLVKEARADDFLNSTRETYRALEKTFNQKLFHEKEMLRLFSNDDIKQSWQRRVDDPAYQSYIGQMLSESECGYESGGFLQKQTGYLSTISLLDAIKDWLQINSAYQASKIDYSEINITNKIEWQNYSANRIIFCEGAKVSNNPWFSYLPMQPAQGEILTLETDESLPDWIINGGKWLLPTGQGQFKTGATYQWPKKDRPLDEKTTTEGQQELLNSLQQLLPNPVNFRLIEHKVGIRPNSLDKRPLLGAHPQHANLFVFNGFGSRGSMLIPYYSQHMVNVLLNNETLESDVDIQRIRQ
ncbi:MAG: FAD-binding oxidoreductase [Gammaproteobacteria bacterium]|nr:FAD-binding oxidoreductase [Gammaproteobacteria bacterium]